MYRRRWDYLWSINFSTSGCGTVMKPLIGSLRIFTAHFCILQCMNGEMKVMDLFDEGERILVDKL